MCAHLRNFPEMYIFNILTITVMWLGTSCTWSVGANTAEQYEWCCLWQVPSTHNYPNSNWLNYFCYCLLWLLWIHQRKSLHGCHGEWYIYYSVISKLLSSLNISEWKWILLESDSTILLCYIVNKSLLKFYN